MDDSRKKTLTTFQVRATGQSFGRFARIANKLLAGEDILSDNSEGAELKRKKNLKPLPTNEEVLTLTPSEIKKKYPLVSTKYLLVRRVLLTEPEHLEYLKASAPFEYDVLSAFVKAEGSQLKAYKLAKLRHMNEINPFLNHAVQWLGISNPVRQEHISIHGHLPIQMEDTTRSKLYLILDTRKATPEKFAKLDPRFQAYVDAIVDKENAKYKPAVIVQQVGLKGIPYDIEQRIMKELGVDKNSTKRPRIPPKFEYTAPHSE
jgi:hypothetical protein